MSPKRMNNPLLSPATEYPPVHDSMMLLRPLSDEHLLEVYREAIAMDLSAEFVQLIEEAIRSRKLDVTM